MLQDEGLEQGQQLYEKAQLRMNHFLSSAGTLLLHPTLKIFCEDFVEEAWYLIVELLFFLSLERALLLS